MHGRQLPRENCPVSGDGWPRGMELLAAEQSWLLRGRDAGARLGSRVRGLCGALASHMVTTRRHA